MKINNYNILYIYVCMLKSSNIERNAGRSASALI